MHHETYYTPWHTALPAGIALLLFEAAATAAHAAKQAAEKRRQRLRPPRGLILAPGPDTPLWNELIRQVGPHLRKRGSKAQLARILGLPRQRLQVCLKARTACFDAERALLLLAWLSARHQGRTLIA